MEKPGIAFVVGCFLLCGVNYSPMVPKIASGDTDTRKRRRYTKTDNGRAVELDNKGFRACGESAGP